MQKRGGGFDRLSSMIQFISIFLTLCVVLITSPIALANPGGIGANLTLWLDAKDSSTLYQDSCGGTAATNHGHRIACWQDRAGNTYNFTAAGNIRPTLRTSSQSINFNPSLEFDGSEDYLEDADGEAYINGASSFTFITVTRSHVSSTDKGFLTTDATVDDNDDEFAMRYDKDGADGGGTNVMKAGIDTTIGGPKQIESRGDIQTTEPQILAYDWESQSSMRLFIYGANTTHTSDEGPMNGTIQNSDAVIVGRGTKIADHYWDGTVAEIIYYRERLNKTARTQVHSYLSIKYGITLNESLDYLSSDLSVVYNSTGSHQNYTNDIAGVGRDDDGSLHQVQSQSVNNDSIVSMENGSAFDDKEFLLWGNDNGALTEIGTNVPTGVATRLTRVWRVDTTGDIDVLTLQFNLSGLSITGTSKENFTLLIDSADSDFTTGATQVAAASFSDNVAEFTLVNFSGDDYFTLGTSADDKAPNVTNIIPGTGSIFNTTKVIEVAADVSDDLSTIDAVFANITFPNNTVEQLTLSLATGTKYNTSFTVPVLAGNYSLQIIANDSKGNVNSSETGIFLATLNNPTDILPILGWYDASDNTSLFTDSSCLTQVTSDLDEVACLENKAGGTNATVVAGKSGARYRSLAAERISNSTTLRFNKSNGTVYQTAIDIRADTTEDVTIFAVYRPRTNDTSDQGQGLWGNDNGAWDRFYYSLFAQSVPLGTDGIDDGLISLGGGSNGLAIDGGGLIDTVFLLTAIYDGNVSGGTNSGPVNGSQIYFDGKLQVRFTDQSHATAAETQMYLGWDGDNGHYDGDLAEVIVYDQILNLCQIELVNNYLGAKYGKDFSGISNSYDHGAPHNIDINGISEYVGNCSVNTEVTSAQSSIATIFNPSGLDLNDSLTFAHNDAGFAVTNAGTSNYTQIIDQSWRVDVDNTPGTVSVSFDLSTTSINLTASTFALLIDSNTDFSDATEHTTGVSVSGNVVTFTNVSFSNTDYFSLGLSQKEPPIYFIDPTLSNNTLHSKNNFVVNITSTNHGLDHYTFTDFDGSLVLWMRMDETNASGDPSDLSGQNNNGKLLESATINASGYFGNAVHLDGTNDDVVVADSQSLKFGTGDFTYSLWVNANDPTSGTQQLLCKRVNGANNYEVQLEATGRFRSWIGDGSATSVDSTTIASANTWYHITMTRGAGVLYMYVNGVLENQTASTHDVTSASVLRLGQDTGGASEYFDGAIDDVLIFNRSFSAAEVQALYNASANQYVNTFSSLAEGNHSFIGYAVSTNAKKNQTELRIVEIDSQAPQISFAAGTLPDASFTNRNFVFVDVSVTEPNEANITFTLFNSSLDVLNETVSAAGTRSINFTSLADGTYHYNVTVVDLTNVANSTQTRTITIDTAPPSVTNLVPTSQTFNTTDVVPINATVTDTHLVDTVYLEVIYPNGTIEHVTMTNVSSLYSANYTFPVLTGVYNLTIIANDSVGNINNTESQTHVITLTDPTDVSNLRVWYDATDNSTLYTDDACSTQVSAENQEIRCWQDKSSNSHNATNVSGKGVPEFTSNQFNGHSVLNFSKSQSDTLRHELASAYTSNFTIFTVIQSRDSNPEVYDAFFSNGQPAHEDHFQIDYTNESDAFRFGASTKFNFENFSNDIKLYSATHDGSTIVLYNEGQEANSGAASDGQLFEHYRINQNRQGNKHHDSRIAEIIIYDRVLTTCELEMVNIYLGDKYGRDFFGVDTNYDFGAPHNNDVNGIGRFPGNCSTTVDIETATSHVITISNPSSLQLNDSLVVGHDSGGTSISTDAPSGYSRMNQSWRVDENDGGNGDGDSVGLVSVAFDISTNPVISNYSSFVLLIDDDATFSNATIETTGTLSGTTVSFTNINLTNSEYLTLGFSDTTPPSVTSLSVGPATTFTLTDTFEIDANATDAIGITTVLANITLPNGSISQITLTHSVGDNYENNFTGPGLIGTYTVRIIASDAEGNVNDTETTTFEIQNDVPDPSGVSVNDGDDITLTSGNNTTVIGTATITDLNGFSDISQVLGYLYLTDSGVDAEDNTSDHYTSTCTTNGDGSGNTISFNCTFNVSHHAIPTDAGSNKSLTNWTFLIEPTDAQGTGTNGSAVVELDTLAAFSINPSVIEFGEVDLNSNTSNTNQAINVTNKGNVGIDILLSGTNLSCTSGSVSVAFVEYEDAPFTYGAGVDLSDANVELDLDALPGTQAKPTPLKTTYYGLGIPAVAVGGSCNGSIVITAQQDPNND